MNRSVLNIAHRGASGRFPENTIAAFRGAIEAGAVMCELDVQRTRDGEVVVIHDDTVERTTDGTGQVSEMTLVELKRLDASARFKDRSLHKERIPTLNEVFAAVAGRCALNIELKEMGIEREVDDLIRKWDRAGDSMVSSFEWDALRAIRKLDSTVKIGVLAEKNPAAMLDEARRIGAFAVNPRFDLVTPELCAQAHSFGLKVLAWTVDVPELMNLLIEYGVDGIMTNYPERLREVLGGAGI